MAPQCFNMTIMEMCRALGNALAMAGDQTDDIDLAFQNPQDRKRHLGEIRGILDDDAPAVCLQHRGVICASPECPRLRGLLVDVQGGEMEVRILARGDRQQVLGGDRVPV